MSPRLKVLFYIWLLALTVMASIEHARVGQLQRDLNAANIAIYDLTHGGKR